MKERDNAYSGAEGERLELGWKNLFTTLWQEVFPLVKANLCFLLFCLPVITIPAAFCAMHGVCTDGIRSLRKGIFRSFWDTIRSELLRAWGVMLPLGGVFAVAAAGAGFYFSERPWGLISLGPGLLLSSIALTCLMALPYAFTMLARMELRLPQLLKNALLLVFLNFKFSVCGGVLVTAIVAVQVLWWLYAIPAILLIGISLAFYFSTYFAFYGLQRFVLTEPLHRMD